MAVGTGQGKLSQADVWTLWPETPPIQKRTQTLQAAIPVPPLLQDQDNEFVRSVDNNRAETFIGQKVQSVSKCAAAQNLAANQRPAIRSDLDCVVTVLRMVAGHAEEWEKDQQLRRESAGDIQSSDLESGKGVETIGSRTAGNWEDSEQ